MNKTIIININGTVFHIEESAYEILKRYMTAVKRHFFDSEDSLEITTDIENRVAELFTEILARDAKQAITDQDVTEVINQMGAVEDFERGEAEPAIPHTNYTTGANTRRLFRSADDHLVAGVCAGIANYFDTQAVWIRLAFAVSFVFAGTGLFIYLILWIVLPKAVTRADRMAMKGEKLDLQGFKRNFEEETLSLRERLADVHRDSKPFVYRFRDFLGEFFGFLGSALGTTGKLLVKIIGIGFLLSFFGMAIALIVLLISVVGFGHDDLRFMFPFRVIGSRYDTLIYVSAFFAAIVPLIALILILIRLLFNSRSINTSVGSLLIAIWICAVGTLLFYSAKIASNYRESASFSKTIAIAPSTINTYKLELNDVKFFTAEDSAKLNINSKFGDVVVTDEDDFDEPESVHISIEKSDVAQPVLIERFSAQGKNYETALYNARNTSYNFTQQDSVLRFDRKIHRLNPNAWFNEEVDLVLKVPVNTKIVISDEAGRYTNLDEYDCRVLNKTPDAPFANFIMTNTGIECKVDTLVITQSPTADSVRLRKK